jgi:hypothetical protein
MTKGNMTSNATDFGRRDVVRAAAGVTLAAGATGAAAPSTAQAQTIYSQAIFCSCYAELVEKK